MNYDVFCRKIDESHGYKLPYESKCKEAEEKRKEKDSSHFSDTADSDKNKLRRGER